jgi:hypothetical protein
MVGLCSSVRQSRGVSRAFGRLRGRNDMRGPMAGIIAALATLALAAGCGATAAGRGTSTQRDAGTGWVAGTVVLGRDDSGAVVTAVRCGERRSQPRQAGPDGCPEGSLPQQVAGADLRPGDDQFRFRLKLGRYRIEDQLTEHSTPVGCIDATHTVSVQANQTTRVTLYTAILKTLCHGY